MASPPLKYLIVHPPSITPLPVAFGFSSYDQADLQHTDGDHLPLLPSDPGGVREPPLRGTRSSALSKPCPNLAERHLGWEFNPTIADCGYRAPLVPRLARPNLHRPAGLNSPAFKSAPFPAGEEIADVPLRLTSKSEAIEKEG